MSTFEDSSFNELDEISKLIEPIQSVVNDEFVNIPEKIEITLNMLHGHVQRSGPGGVSINKQDVLGYITGQAYMSIVVDG